MNKFKVLFINLICGGVVPGRIRNYLLKCLGHEITVLYPGCRVGLGNGHLYMGKGSYCNHGCFFDLGESIHIGKDVAVGMNVHFITTTHAIGNSSRRASTVIRKPIFISDGSWIGADTTILPGVRIGKGVVVGAGSLVTKNLEDNRVYVGRPAKRMRNLT